MYLSIPDYCPTFEALRFVHRHVRINLTPFPAFPPRDPHHPVLRVLSGDGDLCYVQNQPQRTWGGPCAEGQDFLHRPAKDTLFGDPDRDRAHVMKTLQHQRTAGPKGTWGSIANPSHQNQRILGGLFFAGPPNPRSLPLYTRHPRHPERLDWSDDADIETALRQMTAVGLNTIKLSYWGHEGETDRWSPAWLFSQTRWPGDPRKDSGVPYTEAEQVTLARRFFRKARAGGLLVAPMLEVSPKFEFWREFPGNTDNLVARSAWLLKHFGAEPNWLRVYDRDGRPRHAVWLIETIHGGPVEPAAFAAAFDTAARRLRERTKYTVGFILNPTPLPAYGSQAGPEPAALRRHASVLAVNPANTTAQGIVFKESQTQITEEERLQYAETVLKRWSGSGIPMIAPIIPGYDAHIVFPKNGVYGFNPRWRRRQQELAVRYETAGLSIETWNGWTEGYAIPPSVEDGDTHMQWVRQVVAGLRAKWRRSRAAVD